MAHFMQQCLSHKKGKSSLHDNNSNNGNSVCFRTRNVIRTLATCDHCLPYSIHSSYAAQKSHQSSSLFSQSCWVRLERGSGQSGLRKSALCGIWEQEKRSRVIVNLYRRQKDGELSVYSVNWAQVHLLSVLDIQPCSFWGQWLAFLGLLKTDSHFMMFLSQSLFLAVKSNRVM